MAHACENCKFRAHYDAKPNSALVVSGDGTSISVLDGRRTLPPVLQNSKSNYARNITLPNIKAAKGIDHNG